MEESYFSDLSAGAERRYRDLEKNIMADVIRRIKASGEITSTADWQIQRLAILGSSTEDIREMVAQAVDGNEEEVRKLYEQVIANEYTSQQELYTATGKEFIPYEQNAELKQVTEALIRQSTEDLTNITKSTGFMVNMGGGKTVFTPLSDIYNDYLDDAIMGMASGAYDYNTLVRKTTNMMTQSGLRSDYAFGDTGTDTGVQYASGWHNRIDVAVRRSLLTGFSQLAGRVTDMNAQQLNTNYFEVSAHAAARPDHAAWQGRVYTKQQLVQVCGLGSGGGLLGWNCRHSYYPFIPGISQRNYTDEYLEELAAKEAQTTTYRGKEYNAYQATQKQRQLETAMRAQREKVELLKKAGADPDEITVQKCKYQALLNEYHEFSNKMGLTEQLQRVYTGRTAGRIAPSQRTYKAYQAEQEAKAAQRMAEKAEKARRADMAAAKKTSTARTASATMKLQVPDKTSKASATTSISQYYADRVQTATTIEEARTIAKDVLGIDLANYGNVNIDVANLINNEIAKVYDAFGNIHAAGGLDRVVVSDDIGKAYAVYYSEYKEIRIKDVTGDNALQEIADTAKACKEIGFWSTGEPGHFICHEACHAACYAKQLGVGQLADIEALRQSAYDAANIEKWSTNDYAHMPAAGKIVSYYALQDVNEFIAESATECIEGSPRAMAKEVMTILMEE